MSPVRTAIGAALIAAASPALAQHAGHGGHGGHGDHAAPAQPQPQPQPAPTPTPTPTPHAPTPTPPPADHQQHQGGEHAGHAGHAAAVPAPAADQGGHAGHAPTAPTPPVAPPTAAALSGPEHAADLAYDPAAMARARDIARREHGAMTVSAVMIDRLEADMRKGGDGYAFEADAWTGGDIDRLWVKAKGHGAFDGGLETVELQGLWRRAINPWFNLDLGVRQDLGHGPDRTHAVIGLSGLAPYWFEIDAAAFVSTKGDVTARFEAEYDQRLTQKLILQPAVEMDFSAQKIPELGLGSGLTSAEVGLRLRYEFVPEFAPYLGIQYTRAFGRTADYRRAADEDVGGWSFLAGIRAWF